MTDEPKDPSREDLEAVRRAVPFPYMRVSLGAPDTSRHEAAKAEQLAQALSALKAAKRPVSYGYLAQRFTYVAYRGLETELRKVPGVATKKHKGKTYYVWKGIQ
jgi:hypothetical protein